MIVMFSLFFLLIATLLIIRKKDIIKILFLFSLLMAIVSFYIVPFYEMDLYRHYTTLNLFRLKGWGAVIQHRYFESLPIYSLFFYSISKLNHNGFLPAITMFLNYFLIFKTLEKVYTSQEVQKKAIFYSLLFFISTFNFFGAVSGIRNILAFVIFIYFAYIDLVQKKKRIICFTVYICLCMFHSSIIILFILRVLLIFQRKINRFIGLIFILYPVYMTLICEILNNFDNIELINLFNLQIQTYLSNNYMEIKAHLHRTIILFFILILFYIFNKDCKNRYPEFSTMNDFMFLCLSITVGSYNNFNMFARFVSLVSLICPIYILLYLNSERRKTLEHNNKISIHSSIVFFIMIFTIFISMFYLFSFQYKYISFI